MLPYMCPTRPRCTSEDECKWFYGHMIYSPETKQKQDGEIEYGVIEYYYYLHTNGIIHSDYILCARWVLLVTPDSSSSLPGCSMRVLPPSLLLINFLSCSLPGGSGPPPLPLLG
jgi:hypothetical protein